MTVILYAMFTSSVTSLVCRSPECRTRESVAGGVGVNVEDYARHAPGVEASSGDTTSGGNASASANLQVDALRVQLRAVVILAAVQGNDLMTEDVVTGSKLGRNLDVGDKVVLDERVGDPGVCGDDGVLRELGPPEGARGQGGAITIAGSNVVDDWSLVGVGPGVPSESKCVASIGAGVKAASRRALVAVDIRCSNIRRLNEAEILVQSVPASGLRPGIGGVVVPDWVRAIGDLAVDGDRLDVAVGGNNIQQGRSRAQEED